MYLGKLIGKSRKQKSLNGFRDILSYFNGTNTSYEYARKYIKKPGIFDVRQGLLRMQACTQQKIQNVLQFYDELGT